MGVLIHGMGGLGKSSLAARLCDRLPEFERLVWVGRVDEPNLVNKLAAALDSRELREALQDDKEELKFRLRRVFRQMEDEVAKPFLLVLDDFEANLEPRNNGYVLQPKAVTVLEALVWAIGDTYAPHRLILTCRYDFESNLLRDFYKQPLEGMRGADLRKKCNRLSAFDAKSQVDEALQSQARRLADGNPRLLEWLNKVLLDATVDRGVILQRLEADSVELREQVLAEALLAQIDKPLEEMLRRGLVFELPVPREALAAVCESIPNLDEHIERAVKLGLLEVTPNSSLRVPHILPLKLPEDAEALHKQAAQVLYRLWLDEEGLKLTEEPEEHCLEIHRLALWGKVEKIAIKIAIGLINWWLSHNRYREVVKTCEETLEVFENYHIRHRLAFAEGYLGKVDKAQKDYQQALDSCPPDNEKEKASIITNFGFIKAGLGETETAITLYQQSLELQDNIGDLLGKAGTLHLLGYLQSNLGKFEEASVLFQKSLEIAESISNLEMKAGTLHELGRLKANLGNIKEASVLFQQSLKISESIGDSFKEAATLHELGRIKASLGSIEEAIILFQQSLEISESIGVPQQKAATLHELGIIKVAQGEVETALVLFQQSLEIEDKVRNSQGKATTLTVLGLLKKNLGQNEEAYMLFHQALVLQECMGDSPGMVSTLYCLGSVKANLGQTEEAITLYKQSIALSKTLENGQDRVKIEALYELAVIKTNLGQIEEAIPLYEQSLVLLERTENIQDKDKAEKLYQLAFLKANIGQIEEAFALYKKSLELFERIDDAQYQAKILHELAGIYANQGAIKQALTLCQESLALNERIGDDQLKAATFHQLAGIYANQGDINQAIALYQESLELDERIGQGKAFTLAMLGQLLADEKGDFDTAQNYLQQSLEILERLQSSDAETVRQILNRVKQMKWQASRNNWIT